MVEYVYHVDEEDNVIGKVLRKDMRQKKLLHRGISVLVFNLKGQMLIQKRTMTKDVFPGRYEACIAGTVVYGEEYDETAIREIKEEAGIKGVVPKYLFRYLFMNENTKAIIKVYKIVYDGTIKSQESEVESSEFIDFEKVKEMLKTKSFCDDELDMFNFYLKEYHGKENE
jgi:isopentenyldiphosphate isomerase